tara:strand:- start:384 stop:632 length:249 start_codon:yes stop_codon:yes gene_type:complete
MKAILTFVFILFIGVVAQAQETTKEVKVDNVETTTVTSNTSTKYNEVSSENNNEVARLYKFKNARVLKALAFTTKRNTAKLA